MGEWAKIRSWHAVRTFTRVPGRAISLCGHSLQAPFLNEPPVGERHCWTCVNIDIKRRAANA